MRLALFTVADHLPYDMVRGVAAAVGAGLIFAAFCTLIATTRRPGTVPSWSRLAFLGWILGDLYVASRELFEIGRPLFLFGLPLALAWEACALAFLHKLWATVRRPSGMSAGPW